MSRPLLSALTDETRYHGWVRVSFHALLVLGVFGIIFSAYVPWFLYPTAPVDIPLKTYVGPVLRDALAVLLQYYVLVFLFTRYIRKPIRLALGLFGYYVLLFTFYYYSSLIVKQYFGLPDDYSGSITHFERLSYWDALVHPSTFFHLLFIIERAFYPLAVKLLVEIYRRQVRNARLQQQYTQLELNFLKAQVNPHFLFNVLNSIYALTEEESPRAAEIVQQLSGLMRYALYDTSETLVPLAKELAFIRDYVALEQLRTAKRLTLELDLPHTVDDRYDIAPFILITFVENAFKHGVNSTTKKSWVKLSIQHKGNTLQMNVANSKPAQAKGAVGGLGLANVRKRLALLYPDQHTLHINDQADRFTVDLRLELTVPAGLTDGQLKPIVPALHHP
ncbi:Inner membrane protein yehU [Fibrisoma limi BUZ 3]|uniref:Inner membrane protein yehU n=1 Tax=Fibrisoma limi BUZ 3 TaxID=1185876 RepID=I2GTR2_9BACT|nr:histidine kinase [Fibrisoma limi]CCH57292.1 Inner membrane protein yehU [Fibrisoma limi BUZ 3]